MSRSAPARKTANRQRALQPGEVAWIAAAPCAALVLAGVVLLGPAIGHAFLTPDPAEALWPRNAPFIIGSPEPAKHGRIFIAMLGPVLLTAIVLASSRYRPSLRPARIRDLVVASQALLLAAVAAVLLVQHHALLYAGPASWLIFTDRTIAIAVAIAIGLLAALRSQRIRRRASERLADTRVRAIACFAVAAAITAAWLLTAVNTEASVGNARFNDLPPWSMGDAVAVLDGRTPLADFHAFYSQLWGYIAAVPMAIFGDTITVFTIAMASISVMVLLAVYAVFRRIVRSSLLALALYLPFLATSLYMVEGPLENRESNAQIFSVWPMRYGGPYLLAWLTARHLDGAGPRRPWLLFLLGGLVAINNAEFGLGAFAATVVALACMQTPLAWRPLARLAGMAAAGLLGAAVLVSALTLLHGGNLPHPGFLSEYPRLFGVDGWVAVPMPSVGFHLVIYATFAAALCAAAARLVMGAQDSLLTAMLAWSGVFGFAASSYYSGRSDDLKLAALFSAWMFALVLLLIAVGREQAAATARRYGVAALVVLFGFGLSICSLTQFPTPWSQVARIREHAPRVLYKRAGAVRFIDERTRPGESVAILMPFGHRIAYDLSLTNVSPYAFITEIATRRQMQTIIDSIRQAHAHKVFVPDELVVREHLQALAQAGFTRRADRSRVSELSDAGEP